MKKGEFFEEKLGGGLKNSNEFEYLEWKGKGFINKKRNRLEKKIPLKKKELE